MSHPPQEPRWATDEGIFFKMLGYLAKRQTKLGDEVPMSPLKQWFMTAMRVYMTFCDEPPMRVKENLPFSI